MPGSITGKYKYILYATMRLCGYAQTHECSSSFIFQLVDSMRTLLFVKNRDYKEYAALWHGEAELLRTNTYTPSDRAEWTCRLMMGAGYLISVHEMIKYMPPVIQTMLETGVYTSLETAVNHYLESLNFADTQLSEYQSKVIYCNKIGTKTGIKRIQDACHMMLLSTEHLMQESSIDITEVIASLPEPSNKVGLQLVFNYYFLEDYTGAKALHASCKKEKRWINQSLNFQTSLTLEVLIMAQLQVGLSIKGKQKDLKKMKQYAARLKKFTALQSDNFLHLHLLAQAEVARQEASYLSAYDWYLQAIQTAEKQGFIRWAAIASERLGSLYLERGDSGAASYYFNEAIYFFSQWGCALKVARLKEQYGSLLLMKQVDNHAGHGATSVSLVGDNLDVLTLIKASQAISGEIQLDKLLQVMLNTAVENAGAEQGIFIEKIKDNWTVMATLDVRNGQSVFSMPTKSLDDYEDLPTRLIQYVLRSKESVVLSHAAEDHAYRDDPYILRAHPKSVLCLPIIHHNTVIGVMYFENNLSVGTFTQERVAVLSTLASQMAISLENARHFEVMEQLYRSTERFVPRGFLNLLNKKTIEEIKVGDSVEVNLAPMFADIRNFTTMSEALGTEKTAFLLNAYMQLMTPIIRTHHGFVSTFLGDGIMALFPRDHVDALDAAVQMRSALFGFNEMIQSKGFKPIEIGIGINAGSAMLITLGEEERIDASVVSDVVNSAARIEGLNKFYGTDLLISDAVYSSIHNPEQYLIRIVDKVRVKGRVQAMYIYEVMRDDEASSRQYIEAFEAAFKFYEAGEFKKALNALENCLITQPDDKVAVMLKLRCENLLLSGRPHDWDGSYSALDK